MSLSIGISYQAETERSQAQQLAEQLQLPLMDYNKSSDYDYHLHQTAHQLELHARDPKLKPVIIDFLSVDIQRRLKVHQLHQEAVVKAMGKTHDTLHIIDATAGFGFDSLLLAAAHHEIILIERSPIMGALLTDALTRASLDPNMAPIITRMTLLITDAITWFKTPKNNFTKPDIIYLDPMFPTHNRTALAHKAMRFLRDLVGEDQDASELLAPALACAKRRVVVKRSRNAPPLTEKVPDFSRRGPSNRFDIYLLHGNHGNIE